MNSSMQNFKKYGVFTMCYPPSLRSKVTVAIKAWEKFCALSDGAKDLPYSNSGAGVGYERKDGQGANADRKENFDVALSGLAWLKQNKLVIKDPSVIDFIEKAVELVEHMKPSIFDFADQVEKAFGLNGLSDEVRAGEDRFFIRFIHYYGDREVGVETASAHVDQSAFTLHLYESHPGLQCLTYDGNWKDMPVSEGQTVIIPAMQLQLRSKGELRGLCHRVIANAETSRVGRFSAVCFIQLKDTPKYDKDTHGRLQEKTPGFNYGMSHEEFSNLFK